MILHHLSLQYPKFLLSLKYHFLCSVVIRIADITMTSNNFIRKWIGIAGIIIYVSNMQNIVLAFAILLWSPIIYRFLRLIILPRYDVVSSSEKLSTLIRSYFVSLVPMFASDIIEYSIELDRSSDHLLMSRSVSIVLIYNNHRVIIIIL